MSSTGWEVTENTKEKYSLIFFFCSFVVFFCMQNYRHVDNILFENPVIMDRFLNYWRKTGNQVRSIFFHLSFMSLPSGQNRQKNNLNECCTQITVPYCRKYPTDCFFGDFAHWVTTVN